MNLFASAAIAVALLTGPLTQADVESRDLPAPGDPDAPQVAQQAEQEVRPVPVDPAPSSQERIAAFWIVLPD